MWLSGIGLVFLRFVDGAEQQTGPAMKMRLGYVFIAILWCLFVLSVISMIELGANTIHSLERLFAPLCSQLRAPLVEGFELQPSSLRRVSINPAQLKINGEQQATDTVGASLRVG